MTLKFKLLFKFHIWFSIFIMVGTHESRHYICGRYKRYLKRYKRIAMSPHSRLTFNTRSMSCSSHHVLSARESNPTHHNANRTKITDLRHQYCYGSCIVMNQKLIKSSRNDADNCWQICRSRRRVWIFLPNVLQDQNYLLSNVKFRTILPVKTQLNRIRVRIILKYILMKLTFARVILFLRSIFKEIQYRKLLLTKRFGNIIMSKTDHGYKIFKFRTFFDFLTPISKTNFYFLNFFVKISIWILKRIGT